MKNYEKIPPRKIHFLDKFLMIMKISFGLLFCCLLNTYATGYSQNEKFTVKWENITVRQLISVLEKESVYKFLYNDDFKGLDEVISADINEKTMPEILDQVFDNSGTGYKILENNLVVIVPRNYLTESEQQKITGTVTDKATGAALPGVTVIVKGTTNGTLTDVNGKYSITAPGPNATLLVSYIGYITQEIPANQNVINIELIEETTVLDEVVVVGYGTQKKVNLTGSIATVSAKELTARPVSNVGQALQGLVPGLQITSNSGNLAKGQSINIRGIATIGNSQGSPLVLIDGMEGDINTVNPNDIDNISVLKDAASSSIYGSRAPFGVILITTKNGSAGKTEVTFNTNYRWNSPIRIPKYTDSYTFAMAMNQGMRNTGFTDVFLPETLQRMQDNLAGKSVKTLLPSPGDPTVWSMGITDEAGNTNWYKEVYKDKALSQEHSLSVKGGSQNATYYISGDYLGQDGLLKIGGDKYERYNVNAKITMKVNNWMTIGYNGKYGREKFDQPSFALRAGDWTTAFTGYGFWPNVPVYDPNGYIWRTDEGSPEMFRDGGRYKLVNDYITNQLNLTIEPVKNLRIFANFNSRINQSSTKTYRLLTYQHDVAGNTVPTSATYSQSSLNEDLYRSTYISPNVYTQYTNTFGLHNINLMAGFQGESFREDGNSLGRQGILDPSKPYINVTSGTDIDGKLVPPSVSGYANEWSTLGYFGRIGYDYNGRYLAEVNMRYDGTSRYQSNLRWKSFPSVSVGWNLAKEAFWANLSKHINTFKFRGSFGSLGNQNVTDDYQNPLYYPTYVNMPFSPNSSSWLVNGARTGTSSAPGIYNSSLAWETSKTWNGGLDLGFFNNRLTSSLDIYTRYTDHMTGPAEKMPAILGTSVPKANITSLKTSGFEFEAAWRDQVGNDFAYSVRVTLFDSHTEITSYPNPSGSLGQYRTGQMLGEIWGYETIGIAKTKEEMDAHLASLPNGGQDALGANWNAGDIMYKDLNGDGKIDAGANTVSNPGDQKIIGNSTPRYFYGVELNASWKGFDFRMFVQGVGKRDYFSNTNLFWGANGIGNGQGWEYWGSIFLQPHLDYFRGDPNDPLGQNLNSYYPRPLFADRNHSTQTRYLLNAAYARLKNLQIGYSLPAAVTKKLGIQHLRVYVSGENLFTITKLTSLFDPETLDEGLYGGTTFRYPLSKVISLGASINF